MGAVSDYIFGKGQSTSQIGLGTTPSLDPMQQSAETNILSALSAGGWSQNGYQSPFPAYTGEVAAPVAPLQNMSLDALTAALGGAQSAGTGTGQGQSTAINTLQSVENQTAPDLTSYYNTNVLQPLQHTFEQTTLPNIVSALGGNQGGPQSTAAQGAVGDAANNFMNTLASTQAQIALQQQQATTNNRIGAASAATAVNQAPIQTLMSILQAGGVPQQIQQTGDTAQAQNYYQGQQGYQTGLSDLLNLLSQKTTNANDVVVDPGSQGLLSSVISAFAGGAGKSLSDRRLKTDIEEIGETDSGFPLYTYRFKDEPPLIRHIGLMAQDVQKERPEAVDDSSGVMVVDYLRALAPKKRSFA
jgi:hypothetical protein